MSVKEPVELISPQVNNEHVNCGCPKTVHGDHSNLPPACCSRLRNIEKMLKTICWRGLLARNITSSTTPSSYERFPLQIHIDSDVKPRARPTTPSQVPINWQKGDRGRNSTRWGFRDSWEGALRCSMVTWCHIMLVIHNQDDGLPSGGRRWTFLLWIKSLKEREMYSSETPFYLTRRISRDIWKTVTDSWNGYHNVPLHEKDLTTFVSSFLRGASLSPQGFLSTSTTDSRRSSFADLQISRGKIGEERSISMRRWRRACGDRSTFWQKLKILVSYWTSKNSSSPRNLPSLSSDRILNPGF